MKVTIQTSIIIKTLSCTMLCFLFSMATLGQIPTAFTPEALKYVGEISNYLNNTKRDDAKLAAEKFTSLQKSGKITNEQMLSIIATSNVLLKRNLTAYPYFSEYINTVNIVFSSDKDATFIKNWMSILDQLIASQRVGDNKKFMETLKLTNGLVEKNALYASDFKTWVVESRNYTMTYDNGDIKITVPNTNLIGYVAGDTIKIANTNGVYSTINTMWEGMNGRVDWSRADMDPNGVYATFKGYHINMSKQEYNVDTVDFVFSQFFTKPIQGFLEDKLITNVRADNATYPRFTSFSSNVKINNLAENVMYEGAFNLFGYKIYGAGNNGEKATLTFFLPDGKTKAMVARGRDITISKPIELNFRDAEIAIYFGGDSIYHPDVNVNYKINKKQLNISRGKDGMQGAKFYDSYHKCELEADALRWDLNKQSIEMMMEEGAGQKAAIISSDKSYSPGVMRNIQGTTDYNPLAKLRAYKEKNGEDYIDASTFAKLMSATLTPEQCLPLIYLLAQEGFVFYDKETQMVRILPKVNHYVMARSGKADFDIIRFGALAKNLQTPMGVINLKNYNIDFNGVRVIPIADSSEVAFFPKNDSMKLSKNRDMEFSGMILAARMDIHGEGFRFNYDPFNVDLKKVDSMIINIPRGDGAYDENNELILRPMNSKIEKFEGLLNIDHPANKSGRSPLKQFPMLSSPKNAYVYYDNPIILDKAYPRKNFYFELDPFKMDSLKFFDEDAMAFDGTLYSANIFEPFKDQIKKMSDFSLGFKTNKPLSGFSAYQKKGTYKGNLTLNLDGLRGTGQIDYLSSNLACPEIIFYPDSMLTIADQFKLTKNVVGVSTPATSSTHNHIKWTPYQDQMEISKGDNAFQMYDDKTTFDGSLLLGTKGLYGNGTLEWDEAALTSNRIKFQAEDLEADTANFRMKSTTFGDKITFNTPNVHAKIDFKTRFGRFVSNVKDIPTDFAYNQYRTNINEFDWDMDKKILDFRSPKESAGSYFVSTKPEQNDLKFLAKRAIYDLKSSILYFEQVPEIRIADSRIIPDSGKVVVEPEAKMRTLYNATIIGDTIKEYQTITQVTADIFGSRVITAKGTYTYKTKDAKEEKINISEIKVNTLEEVEEKEKFTTYKVFAKGNIEEKENFLLYPNVSYKGAAEFYLKDPEVTFNGYARFNLKNPKTKTDWFSIGEPIDPKKMIFHYNEPKSPEGNSILAGIALNNRDSAGMYTMIMGSKPSKSDDNVFEAKGVVIQNESTGEYIFGDSARVLEDATEGNIMKYNDNTGAVSCEGKIKLGIEFGAIETTSAGTINTNISEGNNYNFDLTLGLNLEFSKDMNEKIASLLKTDFENGDLDISSDKFTSQMSELITDPKDESKFFDELNKSGNAVKPKDLNYNILISDTKFIFDPVDMTYRSKGQIGIVSYGESSLAVKVDGYIEFGAQRSSGYFNIYLKSTLGDWIFISYKSSNVQFLTSYDEVNALITAVEPEKRKITRENGKFYVFALGSQTKAKVFLERMKAINAK